MTSSRSSTHTTHRSANDPRRASFRRTFPTVITGLVVAALLAGCSGSKTSSDTAGSDSVAAGSTVSVDMSAVKTYELPAPVHVDTQVSYPQSPPVGGDHNPAWQNCGFYPDAVQNESAVHSMEHGAVWITYRPDLPAEEIDTLRALTVNQPYLLISEFPASTSPVVLTAWGHQLAVDTVNDPRFDAFVETYQQGPQTLEPGAPCTGAVGQPQ